VTTLVFAASCYVAAGLLVYAYCLTDDEPIDGWRDHLVLLAECVLGWPIAVGLVLLVGLQRLKTKRRGG